MSKQLMVYWWETQSYRATITVPDDYPETPAGLKDTEGGSYAHQDWYEVVDGQGEPRDLLELGVSSVERLRGDDDGR